MRIVDEALLQEFREKTVCEYCGRSCPQGCDPAHVFSRGAGRLDIRINVLSLCRGFYQGEWASCHQRFDQLPRDHPRKITREAILEIVAKREGTTPEAIVDEVYRLRRE